MLHPLDVATSVGPSDLNGLLELELEFDDDKDDNDDVEIDAEDLDSAEDADDNAAHVDFFANCSDAGNSFPRLADMIKGSEPSWLTEI